MSESTEPQAAGRDAEGWRLGPKRLNLRLTNGVTGLNMGTLLFGSFFGIAMMGFINASQPYLFEEVLKIPEKEQGPLAGNLTFLSEIVVICSIGLIGAMSDKIGRKPVWSFGFFMMALGYFLYPFATDSTQLTIFRMLFAVGLAANTAMLPAVANDYCTDASRGKIIAVCFMLNGLGFILLLTPLRLLLGVFTEVTGGDPVQTARLWIWSAAGVCLFVSTVLLLGLKSGAPAQLEKREPLLATLKIGIRAGKRLRVALAYFSAVVARGDLAVLSTFFVLWLTQEGMAAGMSVTEASSLALKFYILIQVFALCWLPFFGWIIDRIDRVAGLALAMLLAGGGYASLFFLDSPLGIGMYFSAVLVGMGEMSANLSTLTLIGSVAPEKGRGAVIGLFSLCGAIGILIIAKGGGYLSGIYGPIAPFMLVACANMVVLVLALAVLAYTRKENAEQLATATASSA
ncbi:MAG: MFS transporter [Gammaproteobacteria bacterium]|jgi:MFS family permease|nr:MFS transporter [Gammaproteobacteria bacterium]